MFPKFHLELTGLKQTPELQKAPLVGQVVGVVRGGPQLLNLGPI
jgi:hypothetical protein